MFGIVICLALVGDVSATDQPSQVVTRDDVETLARQYRIQVYNSYRTQRETFDARIDTANEVLEIARRVRREADSQLLLAAWFEQANDSFGDQALPPFPQVNEDDFEKVGTTRSAIANRSAELDEELSNIDAFQSDAFETQTQPTSVEAGQLPQPPNQDGQGSLLKAIGNLFSADQPSVESAIETTNPVEAEIDFDDAN